MGLQRGYSFTAPRSWVPLISLLEVWILYIQWLLVVLVLSAWYINSVSCFSRAVSVGSTIELLGYAPLLSKGSSAQEKRHIKPYPVLIDAKSNKVITSLRSY